LKLTCDINSRGFQPDVAIFFFENSELQPYSRHWYKNNFSLDIGNLVETPL